MVTNFDATRQAQLWLERGAEEATEVLVGMLRTAVLIGGRLIIDRSQLLDGVFFLAVGPDRLAHELGLSAVDPLPITVNCAPGFAGRGPERVVPRLSGESGSLGHAVVSLERQLEDVQRQNFLRASSVIRAVIGPGGAHPWLMPSPGPRWFPGAGFTDRLHPVDPSRYESWRQLVASARERWIDAAERGRIAVDVWSGGMEMPSALAEQRQRLMETCAGVNPHPLALAVLEVESPLRRDAVEMITAAGNDPTVTAAHQRLALALWSRAYYRSIAVKDGALLVAFDDEGLESQTDSGDEAGEQRARTFGLWSPRRTRWQLLFDRRRSSPTTRMRVEGEIHDHLRIIDPGSFRQLCRSSSDIVHALVAERRRDDMYELALACRHVVAGPPSRRRLRWEARVRVALVTLLAFAVAALSLFGDLASLTDAVRVVAVCAATALGFAASLPYADLTEYFRTRRGSMTAVIDLKEM